MATDAFLVLVDQNNKLLTSESTVNPDFADPFPLPAPVKGTPGAVFEIDDYSVDVQQTLSIGSQSTGAGAGKVVFNPFSVTRKVDKASPLLFRMACAGTQLQAVDLLLRKSGGGTTAGQIYLAYRFALVAVKTIAWSHDDEAPRETVTFEYGALSITYASQKPDGTLAAPTMTGWDRVKNTAVAGSA